MGSEHIGSDSGSDPPHPNDEHGRVLPFRPRTPPKIRAFGNLSTEDTPVQDVGQYVRSDQDTDDYGHRMKMNALAVAVLALLIVGGMWVVDTMAQMRKNQDCILSGRRNCAQVAMPPAAPSNSSLIQR